MRGSAILDSESLLARYYKEFGIDAGTIAAAQLCGLSAARLTRCVYRVLLISLVFGALHAPVLATQPCLPSPCSTVGGTVDLAQCRKLAGWIATGTITRVVHHEEGYPVFKDFAEFTFTIKTWEKNAVKSRRELRFQVGWCNNTQPVPKDTSGTFRFFGLPLPKDPSLANQYLYFEPVQARRQ